MAAKSNPENDAHAEARTHLRFGWWALLVFLTLGIVLEALHGFKVQWYLNVANTTRRLMFTLAHAHGTLLSIVNILFGLFVARTEGWDAVRRGRASFCLVAATILLPAGFFLGGLKIYSGDPGLGIVLVPVGAVLLLAGVFITARAAGEIAIGSPRISTPAESSLKESIKKSQRRS